MATFANSSNFQAILKELYVDNSDYLKDMVYKENPLLALMPKNESAQGFQGKYIPVPIMSGAATGGSHTFSVAQTNQFPNSNESFFVYIIQDYQLITVQNLLMEQSQSDAGAFVDATKQSVDGGMRSITNNLAFEMFADGTGRRGIVGAGATNPSGNTYVIPLSNSQDIVQFERGMNLVNFTFSATTISAVSSTSALVQAVDRGAGIITVLASGSDSSWTTAGKGMGRQGDIVSGAIATGTSLCISGLAAWVPKVAPASGDSFWNVDRSIDPTRLGGLRYDASSYTIEEGITNALAFSNREGAKPDLCVMDFASYAALVNSLGAKVQYVQLNHDEVEVAFEGIKFQSAYGPLNVLADRNCPPQTAYLLTMNTWKLRSIGKVPKILTYGMEGLEGLRVGNADALEVRIGHYSNLICNAPGHNCVVSLSA